MTATTVHTDSQRLHALDAVRGFALLLGVAFHAMLSFIPGLPPGFWAMNDNSPSPLLADASFISHVFRMSLFFFIAGFFARLLHQKLGTAGSGRIAHCALHCPCHSSGCCSPPCRPGLADGTRTDVRRHADADARDARDPRLFHADAPVVPVSAAVAVRGCADHSLADRTPGSRAALSRSCRSSGRGFDTCATGGLHARYPARRGPHRHSVYFYAGSPPHMSAHPAGSSHGRLRHCLCFRLLVHRSRPALDAITRGWLLYLIIGHRHAWLWNVLHSHTMAQTRVHEENSFAYAFGVAVLGLDLGLTGAALRPLQTTAPPRRYLADASYWVYIARCRWWRRCKWGRPLEPALEP